MSVHRLACPECAYELVYATLGSRGSYRTDGAFALACAHAREIRSDDAMNCPALRAAAERVLKVPIPGGETAE